MKLHCDSSARNDHTPLLQFCAAAEPAGLQYLEEPVRGLAELVEVQLRTSIPLALDESVDEGERADAVDAACLAPGPALPGGGRC